ncbi:carbohydrate-binding module family 5 protein [Sphaerobolus stellatus SS14]|uniref:chitinase n=1 Tax=Sphaerobolus stellatus (strain SS14) TaxID=990650 RepID=A0A0C9URR2_SPHS4|nr:carbohydrate-binding module family 5 protein [Sphaerobolus stellatus SS14]
MNGFKSRKHRKGCFKPAALLGSPNYLTVYTRSNMLKLIWLFSALSLLHYVHAFDVTQNSNLVVYWGQNSYGATHSDTANFQQTLSFYCQDNSIDVFPLAFMDEFFGPGGLPVIDLSNTCNPTSDSVFSGSSLLNCQFLASDIQTCQSKGKIVTLSMGGGGAGGIWNLFLGGSSSTRPFGNAVLDGIDLDIEGGGTQFFDSFINQIRSHAASASKKYYITGAPQCPFPDAYMGTVLNAVAFDMVYVQFYNNYCGLNNYNLSQDWDFSVWDNWAKNTAVNKNVKIFIGAPASSTAAGSGYVAASTLGSIIAQTKATYSSFGGVMMWDASQAYANNRYDAAIKSYLTTGGAAPPPPPPVSTTTKPPVSTSTSAPHTTTTTSSPPTSGSCAGVAAWSSSVAYNGGAQVVYNGHLWTAKWWSESDTPGGAAGDWTDDGACTNLAAVVVAPSAKITPSVNSNAEAATVAAISSNPVEISAAKTASASQVVKTASPDGVSAAKVVKPSSQVASQDANTMPQNAKTVEVQAIPVSVASAASDAEETADRAHARAFQV